MQKIEDITQKEFELFSQLIYKEIGISLSNSKKFLVKNRLIKRLLELELYTYSDYYRFVQINSAEKTTMLNLITTNETYFFREIEHFNFFSKEILPKFESDTIRIWSAASSVGAEAYTLSMLTHDRVSSYDIIGSDINSEVIKKANIGLFPIKWMDKIPQELVKKYCLKGKGTHEGWFLVDRALVKNIRFLVKNLLESQKDLGMFDVIFLRNVLIYFDDETKVKIIQNVLNNLKVGGYFHISLTENIHSLNIENLQKVQTSIYQKVA